MGGEKEFKTEAKRRSVKGGDQTIGELRIHESKGEVHFHDDAKALKCAVPVATWYSAWERMWQDPNSEFNFADIANGTALLAKVVCIVPESGGKPKLDLHLYIEETEVSDELTAMIKFMEG